MTEEYALSSKDTYVWLGQVWYLLERGYLWRSHMPLHYPKGYTFFLAAPELIYPEYSFAFFYMKFVGIPFLTLYILTIAIFLKNIFKDNYKVLIGLFLLLASNLVFARSIGFVSSSICSLLILSTVIILRSNLPFYFTSFIAVSTFFFNALFAIFYILALLIFLFISQIGREQKLISLLMNNIIIPTIFIIILIIPFVLHVFYVQNVNIIDYIVRIINENAIFSVKLPNSIDFSNNYLLQIRYFLRNNYEDNEIVYAFLDLERRILSYFIIFSFIGLFLPLKRIFSNQSHDLINFGKASLIVVLLFYLIEIVFSSNTNIFIVNSEWFKSRAAEGMVGLIIIFTCFVLEKIIQKAQILTTYLTNRYDKYKRIINFNRFSKILKIERLMVSIILISIISMSFVNRRIYYTYYYEQDQVETMFYIKENIPENSRILVPDFGDTKNAFYNLLSTYKYYKWEYEFEDNSFNETLDYIEDNSIKYILLDLDLINSTEESYFKHYSDFEEIYENDRNIVYEVET
ncbi:MAG: hypothetical protein ACFFAO_16030 [Candidatus Hermodarchaeota archaeon]